MKWKDFWAVLLIVLGVLFFADQFIPIDVLGTLWPLLLIALGIYILMRGRRHG